MSNDLRPTAEFCLLVRGCILICCFLSVLVFKSSQAAEPVLISEWEGFLSSPDYPATYPPNSHLTWIKSVSPGNRVKITIFNLQTTCDTDYLEIKDGGSMASPLIARYCGALGFTEITSSGTQLLLHFVSDNVTDASKQGFQLYHAGDCKVLTNQTSGYITPPNYPSNYPNYMDCLWTIQLHPAMPIILECDEIALEYKEGCIFDYIEILAGISTDSPVMGRYCGILNDSLTFERDGNMSIRFKSDKDKEFHGFRCAYNIFKDYLTTSTPGSTLYGKHSMYGQTHGKSTRNSSKTPRTDSFRTIKGTYSASTDRTQSTSDSPNTLQTDSLGAAKFTTGYSVFMDHGSLVEIDKSEMASSFQEQTGSPTSQVRPSLSSLSPTLSPSSSDYSTTSTAGSTLHEKHSMYGQTHGKSTRNSSKTLRTDSFRTIKGTYSAFTDRIQSTGDSPNTLQTDSLGAAKFTTGYSVSMDHGNLVVIAKSEMASSFQEQTGSSTSQVRPSLSNLCPNLTPSSSGIGDRYSKPLLTAAIIVVLITYYLHIS